MSSFQNERWEVNSKTTPITLLFPVLNSPEEADTQVGRFLPAADVGTPGSFSCLTGAEVSAFLLDRDDTEDQREITVFAEIDFGVSRWSFPAHFSGAFWSRGSIAPRNGLFSGGGGFPPELHHQFFKFSHYFIF